MLGLANEASDELESVDPADKFLPIVLGARVELHWELKQWELLVATARELAGLDPGQERAWIGWAYALREVGRIADAKAVLLDAEAWHGAASAVLHYNLACYHCLLGEMAEAKSRLETAVRMHPPFRAEAREDPDLLEMRGELSA